MTIDYLTYELKYKKNQEILDLIEHIKELEANKHIWENSIDYEEEMNQLQDDLDSLKGKTQCFTVSIKELSWYHFFTKRAVLKLTKFWFGE